MATMLMGRGKRQSFRSVLDLSAVQARRFFLKPESYFRLDLPPYFNFGVVLSRVERELKRGPIAGRTKKAEDYEGVNYTIYSNKDGRYAWRPFQLVHPVLYVDLVEFLTAPAAWAQIKRRFSEFARDPRVKCLSLPQLPIGRRKSQAAQVQQWWLGIEQASIEMALDFDHVFQADVADCYQSIYTHSIPWALHGVEKAKRHRREDQLFGNGIDRRIQRMQRGQTNGIPQGCVLFDFVAEMVLGYADLLISERLTVAGLQGARILRYRDDYRIFTESTRDGELILKALTEVLQSLGLRLNASKTTGARSVIETSLKLDKREWIRRRQGDRSLQKHLLLLHAHGVDFPNSGSLETGLGGFYGRLKPKRPQADALQLISIAIDIGCGNPRSFPVCAAIVSKLLPMLPTKARRREALSRIAARLARLPNSGHLEVWLQRISYPVDPSIGYIEKLCGVVQGQPVQLWNNSWISDKVLRETVESSTVLHEKRLKVLEPVMRPVEFSLFDY